MNPFKKIFLLFTFLLLYLFVNISIGDEQGQHTMHAETASGAPQTPGGAPVINEYTVPTPYSHPFGIAVDSKENIRYHLRHQQCQKASGNILQLKEPLQKMFVM